jgi:hypothetical protein
VIWIDLSEVQCLAIEVKSSQIVVVFVSKSSRMRSNSCCGLVGEYFL